MVSISEPPYEDFLSGALQKDSSEILCHEEGMLLLKMQERESLMMFVVPAPKSISFSGSKIPVKRITYRVAG